MVIATKAFTIISEFKFDVAQAVIESDTLIGQVGKLSNAADSAMTSIKNLGISYALAFSGAGGGILGLLGSAIQSSDKFTQSQLSFANIISSNLMHLTGTIGNFNERMMVSREIMKDIVDDAQKFGIPAHALLGITKSLSAELVPKGLAGENFGAARTMGRNFLKSAPNLNIDPFQAQGQLLRAIEGSAGLGDTLFKRLISEAPEAFAEFGIVGAKEAAKNFNRLGLTQRFQLLNKALAKFSSDAEILTARANSLAGVIQRIRDTFTGFSSILKPLGDVIIPPLVEVINTAIDYLQIQGRQIVKMMADFIGPLIKNPRILVMRLMEVSDIAGNIVKAGKITGLTLTLIHLNSVLAWVGGTAIGASIAGFVTKIPLIGIGLKWLTKFALGVSTLTKNFIGAGGIISAIARFAGLFGFLVIIFQAVSRSIARARLQVFKWFADNAARMAKVVADLGLAIQVILSPFNDIVEGLSYFFDILFQSTIGLEALLTTAEKFAAVIKFLAEIINFSMAWIKGSINGLIHVIVDFVSQIKESISKIMSGEFKTGFAGLAEAGNFESNVSTFAQGFLSEFDKTLNKTLFGIDHGKEDQAIVQAKTEIGKIEINNDFKEQMQPDRIAFSLMEQIQKTANNPRRAANKTFNNGLSGGFGVQGI